MCWLDMLEFLMTCRCRRWSGFWTSWDRSCHYSWVMILLVHDKLCSCMKITSFGNQWFDFWETTSSFISTCALYWVRALLAWLQSWWNPAVTSNPRPSSGKGTHLYWPAYHWWTGWNDRYFPTLSGSNTCNNLLLQQLPRLSSSQHSGNSAHYRIGNYY